MTMRVRLLQLLLLLAESACRAVAGSRTSRSLVTPRSVVSYEIPPFALSFRSKNILHGDEELDGVLLASTLGEPLNQVVSEFVLDVFTVQQARAASDPELPSIAWDFVNLDLHVSVHYKAIHGDENLDRRRWLLAQANNKQLKSSGADWLSFYAEFTGISLYREPTDPSTTPDDTIMYELLGSWLDIGFSEELDVLKMRLRESEAELLRSFELLIVNTHVIPGSNPFATAVTTDSERAVLSKVLLAVLLVTLFVVSTMVALRLARPRWQQNMKESANSSSFPPVNKGGPGQETLPGRHDEEEEALRSSARYFSKHHPELHNVLARITSSLSSDAADAVNLAPIQSPEAVAAAAALNTNGGGTGYTPVGTWFKKLTSSKMGAPSSPPRSGDGLVCEQNPAQYAFPFMDFPRHDGTPCLIYNDKGHGDDENCHEANPGVDQTRSSSSSISSAEYLSEDEFKKQLATHSLANSTFRNISMDDEEEGGGSFDVEFKEKLERVFAMRRRHYEKETILNRARQARKREQRHAEARERDVKLRRHSNEIDLQQIEGQLLPRALSRKNFNAMESKALGESARKKVHRVVASDPDFFASGMNNNLLELEAAKSKRTSDLAHAERLVQATGHVVRRDIPPRSPQMPRRALARVVGVRQIGHSRSYTDEENQRGSVEVIPSIRQSRSYAEKDECPIVPLPPPLPGMRSPRQSPLQPKKKRVRRGSHRRTNSHGSNNFEEINLERGAHDVMTHGIAAYTDFV